MFGYLCNEVYFKQKLGSYISDKIINCVDKESGKTRLRRPEELNRLDRLELAKEFYNSDYCVIEGGTDGEMMRDEIASYIDMMIPQFYAKWYLHEYYELPSEMDIKAEDFGLKYQYSISYYKEYRDKMLNDNFATDKQIIYASRLFYKLHKENNDFDDKEYTRDEMSKIIQGLLDELKK